MEHIDLQFNLFLHSSLFAQTIRLKTLFQKMQFTAVSAVPSQTAAPKPPPLH
jgi:hypothetical protein